MNRKILFVLPLSWMLVACEASMSAKGPMGDMGDTGAMECEPYTERPPECTGEPQAPRVTIHTQGKSLKASPDCVRATPDTTIVFGITPTANNELGSAEILPKKKGAAWLQGENDVNKNVILIDVPKNARKKVLCSYAIKANDKYLDPRVSVE